METMNDWSNSSFLPVDLINSLNEENPMEEWNEVSWIDSMPESTGHDCDHLCSCLYFSSFLLVSDLFGIVNVFIDVSFEGPLNTDVPMINFYFKVRLKIKFGHVINLNSSKIIFLNFTCCIFLILSRIIGKSWSSHAHHPQTPSSHILELNMGNR